MGFEVSVDHEQRVVISTWQGDVDEALLFAYVDDIWRDPDVRGYNELIDFRLVDDVAVSSEAIHAVADYSRGFDNPDQPARSAVVAQTGLVFGLSRMFATIRSLEPDDNRQFEVFDDLAVAEQWIANG